MSFFSNVTDIKIKYYHFFFPLKFFFQLILFCCVLIFIFYIFYWILLMPYNYFLLFLICIPQYFFDACCAKKFYILFSCLYFNELMTNNSCLKMLFIHWLCEQLIFEKYFVFVLFEYHLGSNKLNIVYFLILFYSYFFHPISYSNI